MFEMGPYSSFVLEARTEALRALQGVFYSSYLDLVGNIFANIGIITCSNVESSDETNVSNLGISCQFFDPLT